MKMTIPAESAFEEWRRDPAYRKVCEELEEEFSLAAAIIHARAKAGLSQTQLARRMHTTKTFIERLESGRFKPSTRMLEKLASATGMRLKISFGPLSGRRAA